MLLEKQGSPPLRTPSCPDHPRRVLCPCYAHSGGDGEGLGVHPGSDGRKSWQLCQEFLRVKAEMIFLIPSGVFWGRESRGAMGCGSREGLGPGRCDQHRAHAVCMVVSCCRGDSGSLSHFIHITPRPSAGTFCLVPRVSPVLVWC